MALSEPELHAMLARGSARILGQPATEAPAMPEKDLLARVRHFAHVHGYLCYHTLRSAGSAAGYPDLTLVKPGRLIFAELKSLKGKLTQDQTVWLDVLAHSVCGVETYCWRPTDWETIVHRLA